MAAHPGFVILGAGHAGGRAADWLRRLGFEGVVTLIGREPAAPYERPPLSKALITGDKRPADCALQAEGFYRDNAIDLLTESTAVSIDPGRKRVTLEGGRDIAYDKLLLTTGASPRSLPLAGAGLAGVHLLRDLGDSAAIRAALGPAAKLVVVGGGFIGLEVAASARKLGAEVTVLEVADRLLGRSLPPGIAADIGGLHRAAGVEIRLAAGIEAFLGETRLCGVALKSGEVLEASLAVVGIGVRPECGLAEAAGLACENGILADAACRTDGPDIFVAGDAARAMNSRYQERFRLESWQNAEQQAEIAARAMLGEAVAWSSVPWVWSDQYDWNLQTAGFPAAGTRIVTRGSLTAGKVLSFALKEGGLVGAAALGQGLVAAKDLRVAQMLIERGARPTPEALADPEINLKKLLKSC